MSSFRKIDKITNICGTKRKNNLIYISCGNQTLDHIIGGGLPEGSIFVIEADILGTYCKVLNKYFLAEGMVCGHDIFIANADGDPQTIMKELPSPCSIPSDDDDKVSNNEQMQIAWRYANLRQVESSFGSNTNFGHNYDLSKRLDTDSITCNEITYWTPEITFDHTKRFKNSIYYNLLLKIKEILSKYKYQNYKNEKKNVLRINIQDLGSPLWMSMDYDDNLEKHNYGEDLIMFMYCLRVAVRNTTAVTYITIPSHLFNDSFLMKRLLHSVDNAVRIESFTGSEKETNPVYQEYHGLFHITKLSAINSLVPFVPPSFDLAFKLRRKKFVIEKLHLPPELDETKQREQDDITTTSINCGGFKKKNIDF